jgi:hydrogenase maturation factor HypF (carbamoyltransferase family)
MERQLALDGCHRPLPTSTEEEKNVLRRQLEQSINTPLDIQHGRFFDAASALIGVRQTINYEAHKRLSNWKLSVRR